MRIYISALMLLFCSTAYSVEIDGDTEVPEHAMARLELTGLYGSAVWEAFTVGANREFIEADGGELNSGLKYWFTGPPGRYRVTATYLDDGTLGKVRTYVTIGDSPEPGPGPTPPEPEPDVEPEPEPTPDENAPFPSDGLSVLILYDHQTQNDLSAGHRAVIFGRETRDLLDSATDDRYRIWSEDIDVSQAEEPWREAMEVEYKSLPWLVISNGTTGTSRSLPSTPEAFAELLGEYK